MQQTSEEKLYALMVVAEQHQDAVRALADVVEREIVARRASHKALDESIAALPTTLKTSVSSAVQDVVGRLAASAAKPISDAAAPLAREMEAAASAARDIRKNVIWFAAAAVGIVLIVAMVMILVTQNATRRTVSDSRAAVIAANDQLRQLDQAIEARKTTIAALNAQINEISSEQLRGLQWNSCNGRYCIRVARDQIQRGSFDGPVKSWGRGMEMFVIPEGF